MLDVTRKNIRAHFDFSKSKYYEIIKTSLKDADMK